jgi:hypothetical protein
VKNLEIEGFDYGVWYSENDYSMTFENLTIRNQRVAGLQVNFGQPHIYNLKSVNSVPVLVSRNNWFDFVQGPLNVIVKADLSGGSPSQPAIIFGGDLLLRDVVIRGYGVAVDDQSTGTNADVAMTGATTVLSEYSSKPAQELFPSLDRTLRLPVENAPEFTPPPPEEWANVLDYGAVKDAEVVSTEAFKAALNSGKSVIWIPGKVNPAGYLITETLEVPATVKLIIGPSPGVQAFGDYFRDLNNLRPLFRVSANSPDPVIFEGLNINPTNLGQGSIGVEQASTRTVVFRHGVIGNSWGEGLTPCYVNTVTGGKLFLEDVIGARYRVTGPQKVWARQLNTEYGNDYLFTLQGKGAHLWVLGWKTEDSPTQPMLRMTGGAAAEVLGHYAYMLSWSPDRPWIVNDNSSLAISYLQAGQGARRIPI